MENDPVILFKINDLSAIMKPGRIITPNIINKMTSCRNCEGKYGEVTECVTIEGEKCNFCKECASALCILCSPGNHFQKSNFICKNRH